MCQFVLFYRFLLQQEWQWQLAVTGVSFCLMPRIHCSHIYTVTSTGLNGASDVNGLSCRAGFAGVWVTEELRRSKAADISSDAAVGKRCTMINCEPRLFTGIGWVWNWVPCPKAVLFDLLFLAYHYREQIIYPYHQLLKMWMTNSLYFMNSS